MSTEAPLTKVDSAVEGLGTSPPKERKPRASSSVPGVFNINDLGESPTAALPLQDQLPLLLLQPQAGHETLEADD
jgi:hypothetical protein